MIERAPFCVPNFFGVKWGIEYGLALRKSVNDFGENSVLFHHYIIEAILSCKSWFFKSLTDSRNEFEPRRLLSTAKDSKEVLISLTFVQNQF